ncbi:MAG TPA: hypothetical protein PLQ67_09315, partial [Burkholderiaceae bacterium]|nr:hypothetical protein [Burkholderiaceae bacterium]
MPIANIDNIVFVVTAILFVTLWILLKTVFPDLNTGSGYESKFLTLSESSLGLRRTHKLFLTFLVPCGIILVVGIMQRRGVRPLAILSIPALVLMANPGGSRGVAFLVILAFLISWHALVRPIPRKIWLLLAVCGILAFNLLGAIRSYGHFPNPSELLPWLLSSGEFEHIFGNAVELLHAVQREALHIPLTIRFSELFAFVPSELLIFDKTALPDWFMDNFYPELKAAGGGLAFGVTAQAIVGHGSIEAMVRGLIFGVVLGKVYQLLYRHARHWWVFPVYIYLLTRIFDSVRS